MNTKALLLMLSMFNLSLVTAQKKNYQAVGVGLGLATYAGDVGAGLTGYSSIDNMKISLNFRYFKSDRLSYRFGLSNINFSLNDKNSNLPSIRERGYSVFNSMFELFGGVEINFFEFNPYRTYNMNRKLTPYIATGPALVVYQSKFVKQGITHQDGVGVALSIPMSAGVKFKIEDRFVMSVEATAAYSFTDNLDASSPSDKSLFFGQKNKDWYFSATINIDYSLKPLECFCPPPTIKKRDESVILGYSIDDEGTPNDKKIKKGKRSKEEKQNEKLQKRNRRKAKKNR